jgi:hypothetical protein
MRVCPVPPACSRGVLSDAERLLVVVLRGGLLAVGEGGLENEASDSTGPPVFIEKSDFQCGDGGILNGHGR